MAEKTGISWTDATWPEWLKRTPPPWLRHVVNYRMLIWLDHHLPVCWANLVIWKQFGSADSWWPSRTCFVSFPKRHDYCGKFKAEQEDSVVGPDVVIRFAP